MDKNMDIELELNNKINEILLIKPISFIVMNNYTSKLILDSLIFNNFDKLKFYNGYDILISEDVSDNEFRIG